MERRIFVDLTGPQAVLSYDLLSEAGFRRSLGFAYRPACPGCNACVAVRIPVARFALTRFAAERLLYRLGASAARERCLLKGASLLAVWLPDPYRATRDVDLLASGPMHEQAIRLLVDEICAVACADDGLKFDLSALALETIRAEEEYVGMRARFRALLGNARIAVQLDIGAGDAVAIEPEEVIVPTLLPGMPQMAEEVLGLPVRGNVGVQAATNEVLERTELRAADGKPLIAVPSNVGPRTMDYRALFAAATHALPNGVKAFAGLPAPLPALRRKGFLALLAEAAHRQDGGAVHREQQRRAVQEGDRQRVERVVEEVAVAQRERRRPVEVREDAERHRLAPAAHRDRADEAQHEVEPDRRGERPRDVRAQA